MKKALFSLIVVLFASVANAQPYPVEIKVEYDGRRETWKVNQATGEVSDGVYKKGDIWKGYVERLNGVDVPYRGPIEPYIRQVSQGQDIMAPNYYDGCDESMSNNKPLVTFIGIPARRVPGAVVCEAVALSGYKAPCIAISAPDKGSHWHVKTLPADVAVGDIQSQLPKKAMVGCETGKCSFTFFPNPRCAGGNCPGNGGCPVAGNCVQCETCHPGASKFTQVVSPRFVGGTCINGSCGTTVTTSRSNCPTCPK